jgi:hypothetical protein
LRRYVHPERRLTFDRLHGVTSQKTVLSPYKVAYHIRMGTFRICGRCVDSLSIEDDVSDLRSNFNNHSYAMARNFSE